MKQEKIVSPSRTGIIPLNIQECSERPMEESIYVRIDSNWNNINGNLNKFGKPKYTELFALAKDVLSLVMEAFPKGDFQLINICYLFMEIPFKRKLLLH